jgi:DNA-binding response OmpR family regulator
MLTLKGYEAQSVSSSEMALDAIKERSFDVLLIDCIMPKTDG